MYFFLAEPSRANASIFLYLFRWFPLDGQFYSPEKSLKDIIIYWVNNFCNSIHSIWTTEAAVVIQTLYYRLLWLSVGYSIAHYFSQQPFGLSRESRGNDKSHKTILVKSHLHSSVSFVTVCTVWGTIFYNFILEL